MYWIANVVECFFKTDREEDESEVEYRNNEDILTGFLLMREPADGKEEMPDEEIGWYHNDNRPQLAWIMECAVDMVRKDGNNVREDHVTSNACPYFIQPALNQWRF